MFDPKHFPPDVMALLETAIKSEKRIIHDASTVAKATDLIQRINKTRKRLREADNEGHSPYDELHIRRERRTARVIINKQARTFFDFSKIEHVRGGNDPY